MPSGAPPLTWRPPSCSPLPAASHVETRAYGILRQMEKVANKPAREAGGGGGGGIKTRAASRPPLPPPGGRGPGQRISPAAAAVRHAAAHQAAAAAGPAGSAQDDAVAAAQNVLGADAITIIRKLRTLQRKGGEMEARLVLSKTKKYLATIGARCGAPCCPHARSLQRRWAGAFFWGLRGPASAHRSCPASRALLISLAVTCRSVCLPASSCHPPFLIPSAASAKCRRAMWS